jgi:hypothetical protein
MRINLVLATLSFFVASNALAVPGFVVDSPDGTKTDTLVFKRITYTGQCPGESLDPIRGYFTDADVPTAPGRRVRIMNHTTGLDNAPYPFTDREYDSGDRSEKIDFLPGSEHRQRWFSVVEGLNDFEVYYLDAGKIFKTKQFSFQVDIQTREEQRDAECRVEHDCLPLPPNNGGPMCLPRIVCGCFPLR